MRLTHALLCCLVAAVPAACAKRSDASSAASPAAGAAGAPSGASLYLTHCASCHQVNGEGSPGAFPPLAHNSVVTGDPVRVIHIVKYGLTGPIVVGATHYAGMMPAWDSVMSDAEIAAAITYVRGAWGNSAGPVSADSVAAVAK